MLLSGVTIVAPFLPRQRATCAPPNPPPRITVPPRATRRPVWDSWPPDWSVMLPPNVGLAGIRGEATGFLLGVPAQRRSCFVEESWRRFLRASSRAKRCALPLAHKLFGNGLFEAGCRLGRKPTGDFLRIFEDVERMDLAPPQRDHVQTTIEVRSVAVQQRCRPVPLHKHGGIPRPAFHPDAVDLEMQVGQDARNALEPAAERFAVVALTTDRVGAAKAVMNVWRD